MSDSEQRVSDHRIETDGGFLFARRWHHERASACDPAIVLLHDSLGCIELWRDFPAKLSAAAGLDVVAYDRLGFGQSDPHPGILGLDLIRNEARSALPAIRTAMGIGKMILYGHSVGGGMSVSAGAAFKDDTLAVVTEAAQAFVEDRTVKGHLGAKQIFEADGQLERLARYHGDKAAWVLEAWLGTWLHPEFASWSLDEALANLHCPILAIHGDSDEYGSTAHPERIGKLSAGPSKTVILSGCGHVPRREAPELVLQIAASFIRRVAGRIEMGPEGRNQAIA